MVVNTDYCRDCGKLVDDGVLIFGGGKVTRHGGEIAALSTIFSTLGLSTLLASTGSKHKRICIVSYGLDLVFPRNDRHKNKKSFF